MGRTHLFARRPCHYIGTKIAHIGGGGAGRGEGVPSSYFTSHIAVFQKLVNEQTPSLGSGHKYTKLSTNFQSHNLLEPTRIHLPPTMTILWRGH
jgi:hypothetical protein